MIEGIILQDGVIFHDMENIFAWFKNWAVMNKINFSVKNPLQFKDQIDNILRDGFDFKKVYDQFNLPSWENESFLKKHNHFYHDRSSTFYDGMSSVLREIFVDGKKLMKEKGHRVRIGLNSFHNYENISSFLKIGCSLQYIDTIISQESLNSLNLEKELFSLEKSLPRLVYQSLNLNPKNVVYITNHPSSLAVAKNLKQGKRNGKLICAGAAWAGNRGNLEYGYHTESGEFLNFDYILNNPYELKTLIRGLS